MANEKRVIDEFKSELMSEFIRLCNGNDFNKLTLLKIGDTINRLYEKYSILPIMDAVEVVHGRWVHDENYEVWVEKYVCSVCKSDAPDGFRTISERTNYCPNCGADMRGADND